MLENENGKVQPCQHKNKKVFGDDKIGLYSNFLSKSITASLCGRLIRTGMLKDFSTPIHITTGEDVITNLIMVKIIIQELKWLIYLLSLYSVSSFYG